MGTRSLTTVYEDGKKLLTMYRQMDGYPTGHGSDLKDFAEHMVIVNGIRMNDGRKIANGMGCFAAQLVAHFKNEAGGIYIVPANTKDAGQEYEYALSAMEHDEGTIIHLKLVSVYGKKKVLYEGPLQAFDPEEIEKQYSGE